MNVAREPHADAVARASRKHMGRTGLTRVPTRRRQGTVQGMRSWSLLGRMRRPARSGKSDTACGAGSGKPAGHEDRHRALDWRQVQARLSPVRHRWDLAILCNLDEVVGCRPAELVAAINSQAGAGRELSPQVQSERLRGLERDGYIRHEDLMVIPLHRVYFLQPPGRALLDDLSRITGPWHPSCGAASVAVEPLVRGQ